MNKNEAQFLINNVYNDCLNYMSWDTEDENNWFDIRCSLEQLADYFGLEIQQRQENKK